jgi:hypothetical protein
MKIIILFFPFLGLFNILGCRNKDKKEEFSLAGKVYQTSDGMDQNCKTMVPGTDYFQTIFFINENEFVQIINACCPSPEEDFAKEYVSRGLYKMDEKSLKLTINKPTAVFYIKMNENDSENTTSVSKTHIEMEKFENETIDFTRQNCKNLPYFKQKDGEFKGKFISPPKENLKHYKSELEKEGIWEKLFQ